MKHFTNGDKIIVAIILIAAIATYAAFAVFVANGMPDELQIFVDGSFYASYKLDEIKEEKIVEISSAYGKNTLKLSADGAEMVDASCPDKTDIRQGKITRAGQVIICIPNRVLVKLSGSDNKIDKVTY